MKQVWVMEWLARDRWSGPEKAGHSFHLTDKHAKDYKQALYDSRAGSSTPEYYENPNSTPVQVGVDESLFRKIKKNGGNYRSYNASVTVTYSEPEVTKVNKAGKKSK